MADLQTVIANYQQLRSSGMEVRAVLRTLRDEIDSMSESQKQELARALRALEKGEPAAHDGPRIRKLKNPRDESVEWMNCPSCGKSNQIQELLCYACGALLRPANSEFETQMLAETNDLSLSNDFYGEQSYILLRTRDGEQFEARPQQAEVVIGRGVRGSAMVPDVDLGPLGGEGLGVSRLHLTLRYDGDHHTITLLDMGSVNGTYVNGQRLHPHEVRVVRDTDELRLGRFVLTINFRHNS